MIQTSLLLWAAAVLPIAVLLVCFICFRMPVVRASLVTLAAAVVSSAAFYGAGPELMLREFLKGAWAAMPIAAVIVTAVLLYQVCAQSGAIEPIGRAMKRLTGDELLQVLVICACFSSFLQGIAGFGVPTAVCAPMLISIGVSPFWAVVLPPLGHSWGNTFGTLALGWEALVSQSTIYGGDVREAALLACAMLWLWNFAALLVICGMIGGRRGLMHGLPAAAVISAAQGGGEMLVGMFNTTICCFAGACASLAAVLILSRTPLYRGAWRLRDGIMARGRSSADEEIRVGGLWPSLLPYFFLTLISAAVLLIPQNFAALSQWKISISVTDSVTALGFVSAGSSEYMPMAPLTHASFLLLLSAIAAFLLYRANGMLAAGMLPQILSGTVRRAYPASASVIILLMMSRLMSGCGMTQVLAQGVADVMGHWYTLAAPAVGFTGAFITGSNTSSNILFAYFQAEGARLLGLSVPLMLAAQAAGAAAGCASAMGTIALGTATAGIQGREGDVLRVLIVPSALAALMLGVVSFAAVMLL